MQELEAQFLDRSLQAPLCQDETVPEGEIENEGALEIATPAAARKRTGHVTDEIRTVWEIWMRMLRSWEIWMRMLQLLKGSGGERLERKGHQSCLKTNQHQLEKY